MRSPGEAGDLAVRVNHYSREYFEEIDTAEKAYWLGLIMADGGIYPDGSTLVFDLTLQPSDGYLLERFCNELGIDKEGSAFNYVKRYDSRYDHYWNRCTIHSKDAKFCRSLIAAGIPLSLPGRLKTGNEVYPDIPQEFNRDFIRGTFDGDGCLTFFKRRYKKQDGSISIYQKGKISWTMGKQILSEIRQKPRNLYPKGRGVTSVLEYSSLRDIKKICEYMYRGADPKLMLKRKYDLAVRYEMV